MCALGAICCFFVASAGGTLWKALASSPVPRGNRGWKCSGRLHSGHPGPDAPPFFALGSLPRETPLLGSIGPGRTRRERRVPVCSESSSRRALQIASVRLFPAAFARRSVGCTQGTSLRMPWARGLGWPRAGLAPWCGASVSWQPRTEELFWLRASWDTLELFWGLEFWARFHIVVHLEGCL